MLAAATMGILFIGPVIVGFIPVMVVGALIFLLGIELMQEALVDTWGKLHRLEYLTVCTEALVMPAKKCSHRVRLTGVAGGDYCTDNGNMGLCHWYCGGDYLGMCQFRGADVAQVRDSSYLFRQDYGFDGSTTAGSAAIPARSRAADADYETGELSLLRNDSQRREHRARVDRRGSLQATTDPVSHPGFLPSVWAGLLRGRGLHAHKPDSTQAECTDYDFRAGCARRRGP